MGYTPSFTPQYENGWEDLPIEETPITAEALNAYDDAIENIEDYLASDESQANLADAYDENATYEAGDYRIHNGNLYKCLEDIDTPEEWDSTKWESCLITDEMATSGGTTVIANPSGQATDTLTKLQVDETIYGISGGGGSANIWEGTQAELEEQFDDIPNETAIIVIDDEEAIDASAEIYSEDERLIGLWTDNKPLYQKTLHFQNVTLSSGKNIVATVSQLSNLSIDNVVKEISGVLTFNSGAYVINIPYAVGATSFITAYYDSGDGICMQRGGNALATNDISLTITYTKTTDVPLSGVIAGKSTMYVASSDCYSTEEKEIGCWSNGKPIYQKVLTTTQTIPFTANTWVKTEFAKGDMDTIIGGFLLFDGQTPSLHEAFSFGFIDGLLAINTGRAWQAEIGARIVIQYTKTTDTAGSGKFTPAGTKTEHYSTEEQVIGTYVDGKPIYRKSFTYSSASLSSGQFALTNNLSNVERVINKHCQVHSGSDNRDYDIPYFRADYNESVFLLCHVLTDNTVSTALLSNDHVSYTNLTSIVVTLEYTKTTD